MNDYDFRLVVSGMILLSGVSFGDRSEVSVSLTLLHSATLQAEQGRR